MGINLFISSITLFLALVISFFVFLHDPKKIVNKDFFYLGLCICLWILSNIIPDSIKSYSISFFVINTSTVIVTFIPIYLNKFIADLYFYDDPNFQYRSKIMLVTSFCISLIFIIFCQTPYNIKSINFTTWGVNYVPGPIYYVLLAYLIFTFSFSLFSLFTALLRSKETQRAQILLILIGSGISIVMSIIMGVIFPILGNSFISEFTPSNVLIFMGFTSVAILRHQLFNIRIITIELVTFALWVFVLMRILFAENTREVFIETTFLIVTITFGILLIKSVIREINQRAHIERLANELKTAYSRLREVNAELSDKIAHHSIHAPKVPRELP